MVSKDLPQDLLVCDFPRFLFKLRGCVLFQAFQLIHVIDPSYLDIRILRLKLIHHSRLSLLCRSGNMILNE